MDDHSAIAREQATRLPPPVSPGKLKLFLALSRTPHAVLDLATPAFSALLAFGGLPPLPRVALGLFTAFAAYTAVYALNDLVDYRSDREKINRGGAANQVAYLDAVGGRHPVAAGFLSLREGVLWAAGWALAALLGSWLLNPVCALLFLAGCLLEAIYCRLQRVSHLRVLVSGVVKTLGGIAAAFAVVPDPPLLLLLLLFAWIFAWEVGGQNIPNDLVDLEEDRESGARTFPVRFGAPGAALVILGALLVATLLGGVVLGLAGGAPSLAWGAAGLIAGTWLLLVPAGRLGPRVHSRAVTDLFNRASLYPLAVLALVLLHLGWRAR